MAKGTPKIQVRFEMTSNTGLLPAEHRDITSIILYFQGNDHDFLPSLNWGAFEDVLSFMDVTPRIVIEGYNPNSAFLHSVYEPILRGTILSKTAQERRLTVQCTEYTEETGKLVRWPPVSSHTIMTAPTRYTAAPDTVELTIYQRTEWLIRRTPHERNAYLMSLRSEAQVR